MARASWLLATVLAGCRFAPGGLGGDDGGRGDGAPPGGDAAVDAPGLDAGADGPAPGGDAGPDCYGTGLVTVCLTHPPTSPSTLVSGRIDTSQPSTCSEVVQTGGGTEVCVIAATTFRVTDYVRVVGTRPLVVVATGAISIEGTLDASSAGALRGAGANPASCDPPGQATSDLGGAGGGAGGSFMTKGGTGGDGDGDQSAAPSAKATGGRPGAAVSAPTDLRGGCPGGAGGAGSVAPLPGGAGGDGGGAVYLISRASISVGGSVYAAGGRGGATTGNGGFQQGGGGGGSGGMIGLDAPSIAVAGTLAANGGGGGGGGNAAGGMAGNDGTTTQYAMAAAGGPGAPSAGAGGRGSCVGLEGPADGADGDAGGGGGGGGIGVVWIEGTVSTANPRISPTPRP